MEFISIVYSYGYPDEYFVCLTDPNQSNPTVYSSDHEVYYSEIDNEGTLEEFLKRYWTKSEFLIAIKEYLQSEVTKE